MEFNISMVDFGGQIFVGIGYVFCNWQNNYKPNMAVSNLVTEHILNEH